MRFLFVSKDRGNANVGLEVARQLCLAGHGVSYYLQPGAAAHTAYLEKKFPGGGFQHPQDLSFHFFQTERKDVTAADAVVVTLSASGEPNLELDVARLAGQLGKPVFGLEDVPGGRHNPGWDELGNSISKEFTQLYTTMKMVNDTDYRVTCVGPLQAYAYRERDVVALGAEARRHLGIGDLDPLVWYIGHPEPESPHVLSRVGEALGLMSHRMLRDDSVITLVVSRHGRELVSSLPGQDAAHQHTMRLMARNLPRVKLLENSPDHHWRKGDQGTRPKFRLSKLLSYANLLCACALRGVVVTGFATDGLMVAPYLGIPSLLFIDEAGFLFGNLLSREKRIETLPLANVRQVATVEKLAEQLSLLLFDPDFLTEHCNGLRESCPMPERNPAEVMAEDILARLAE